MPTEEEKLRAELSKQYEVKYNERFHETEAKLSQELLSFINNFVRKWGYIKGSSPLADDLAEGLKSGKYKKPSEFFLKQCSGLFNGYILPKDKEAFLHTVDNITDWQYSYGYYRRSFRSKDYSKYMSKFIWEISSFSMKSHYFLDFDICDLITHNLPPEEKAFVAAKNAAGYCESLIAYELDKGNPRLEKIITDIIMGEGGQVSHTVLRGINRSHNKKMHELVGKLLLAARLQEGLRQAICETADEGTAEAFLSILKVIEENNLIRFSSVKRALGTWTGLGTDDPEKIGRIYEKNLKLVIECIDSKEARDKYLKSEDCMEIHIALWAYGFFEVNDAVQKVKELSEKGTEHQILTAGYFVNNLNDWALAHETAKKVIMNNSEPKILAVYMPYFMNEWSNGYGGYYNRIDTKNHDYFKDGKETLKYFNRIKEIYDTTPKSLEFSPCIFPWYSATLTKASIAYRLCRIGYFTGDNDIIDSICPIIKDCDGSGRGRLYSEILKTPKTEIQKAVIVEALGDKDSFARKKAKEVVEQLTLNEENYLKIEEMLRFKASDIRSNLIDLLYKRPDDALYSSVCRLTSDKKEEKRTAGLDLIIRLSKDENRRGLFEKCRPAAEEISDPSTKEKILIDSIMGAEKEAKREKLYNENDKLTFEIPDNDFTKECVKTLMDYFPDSGTGKAIYPDLFKKGIGQKLKDKVGADCGSYTEAVKLCENLAALIKAHNKDEFTCEGEVLTVDCRAYQFYTKLPDGTRQIAFKDLWESWYSENKVSPQQLLRMKAVLCGASSVCKYTEASKKYVEQLLGAGFTKRPLLEYEWVVSRVTNHLINQNVAVNDLILLSNAAKLWFIKCVPDSDALIMNGAEESRYDGGFSHLICHSQISFILRDIFDVSTENLKDKFILDYLTEEKCFTNPDYKPRYGIATARQYYYNFNARFGGDRNSLVPMTPRTYIRAAYNKIISEGNLYSFMFRPENLQNSLSVLSYIAAALKEEGRAVSERGYSSWKANRFKQEANLLVNKRYDEELTEEDKKLLNYAADLYEKVIDEVLSVELKRGDSPTEYSSSIRGINRIYGAENLVAILSALGKETLDRSSYYYSNDSKKSTLSHLLGVCIPDVSDDAKKLKKLVKGTDITDERIIEAALYSPEWLDIAEEYLGWNGFKSACYYFMAHMNEQFDDRRTAMIAKYTPLTPEELHAGAFDIDWFKNAYETLGEKRFNVIYKAAKYISDGIKHSRARKYADAALNKLDTEETKKQIADKRNKDLLMAYTVIPIKNEDDICTRYLYLQQFLKESKKFGSQRSASEKKAVETAMKNLAVNSGYADETRLTLRMETKLIDDSRELFNEKEIEDVTVKLSVQENGKSEIICNKNGKPLKSVPAKLKKNEYILRLTETKKRLTEQYRRTRQMFEQAMEDSTEFEAEELTILRSNPVVLPIIKDLVFVSGKNIGFFDGKKLTNHSGEAVSIKKTAKLRAAHPFDLYKDGSWAQYQQKLFESETVQPFKQVFRELYVKTEEELEKTDSRRYSGNQIQPSKTAACLKSRRWVADVENGLQKVYYKKNITAKIYAIADWFSPADIEAPTLEWVEFSDRKSGKPIKIADIPDIIFSEVMRDVDLAVSVAHAGGVDPETSHSTMEMRAALLRFTLPLFKLENVEIVGSHAHIKGKFGEYTVHLGSGVIHKKSGPMINILAVRSQHRGKLFLPFADDDPKTAEILTKVLFLAEDSKIKDPTILSQIK